MKNTYNPQALKEAIVEFLEWQQMNQGASPLTLQAYRTDLKQWITWLQTQPDVDETSINSNQLSFFFHFLKKRHLRTTSLARKMSTLRQFFKFCMLERTLPLLENPMQHLPSPQLKRALPETLSIQDVQQLLEATQQGLPYHPSQQQALHLRDRAMVFLLYATGVRVSELLKITGHQIHLAEGWIRILGKRKKERIIPFAPLAGDYLAHYLQQGRPLLNPQTESIFLNHRGQALSRQTFWKIIKSLAKQANLPHHLSPHTLRHSFASHLLESGIHLRSLQMLLGHSDLSTTQIYTHLSPEHLKKAHQTFHPRGV